MKTLPDDQVQELALLMAVNCVRNTIIEDYHSQGKLTDKEMKTFNREVVNKIYTFIKFMFAEPSKETERFSRIMQLMYPTNWDKPELDSDMLAAAQGKANKDLSDTN